MSKRVEFLLKRSFSGSSTNGQVFGWLKGRYGSASGKAILQAVQLLYLPAALAEGSPDAAQREILRSRCLFEAQMQAVLETCRDRNDRSVMVSKVDQEEMDNGLLEDDCIDLDLDLDF
ncbi:MAG: hypothetical protein WCD18_01240 [Thermosynechococcaceae cyanobacterium]